MLHTGSTGLAVHYAEVNQTVTLNLLRMLLRSLQNRRTFLEWSKTMMGPINDRLGVEQGGINSGNLY